MLPPICKLIFVWEKFTITPFIFEQLFSTGGNSIWLIARLIPIIWENGRAFLLDGMDKTIYRKLE